MFSIAYFILSESNSSVKIFSISVDLTQGEKFFSVFYNIFRGNSNKNLHYPRINISLSMYYKTAARKH